MFKTNEILEHKKDKNLIVRYLFNDEEYDYIELLSENSKEWAANLNYDVSIPCIGVLKKDLKKWKRSIIGKILYGRS